MFTRNIQTLKKNELFLFEAGTKFAVMQKESDDNDKISAKVIAVFNSEREAINFLQINKYKH